MQSAVKLTKFWRISKKQNKCMPNSATWEETIQFCDVAWDYSTDYTWTSFTRWHNRKKKCNGWPNLHFMYAHAIEQRML